MMKTHGLAMKKLFTMIQIVQLHFWVFGRGCIVRTCQFPCLSHLQPYVPRAFDSPGATFLPKPPGPGSSSSYPSLFSLTLHLKKPTLLVTLGPPWRWVGGQLGWNKPSRQSQNTLYPAGVGTGWGRSQVNPFCPVTVTPPLA